MKLIAHLGNVNGIDAERQNTLPYINKAIELGYDTSIDLWLSQGLLMIGGTKKTEVITSHELHAIWPKVWVRARNVQALEFCLDTNIHCLTGDWYDLNLTSRRFIWTPPNKELTTRSIVFMPEHWSSPIHEGVAGICSDNVLVDYVGSDKILNGKKHRLFGAVEGVGCASGDQASGAS